MVKKVLGMGNAVLDILVETSDSYLQKNNLSKGSMVLVEQEESDKIVNDVTPTKKDSGGSVANSMVGISVLGGSASFCGKVKNDELGQDFEKRMQITGTQFLCTKSIKITPLQLSLSISAAFNAITPPIEFPTK